MSVSVDTHDDGILKQSYQKGVHVEADYTGTYLDSMIVSLVRSSLYVLYVDAVAVNTYYTEEETRK